MFNDRVSTESLNRTSNVVGNPSQVIETSTRVNVDVLKHRLLEEDKKEKKKRRIIFYSVLASLGAFMILTY